MKRHHPLLILLLAFGLAFLFAITWVIVMTFSLPSTDGAYGQMPFADPLVFPIMSMFAGIAAVFTFPFLYFTFRSRSFPRAPLVLAGIVMAVILVVTPIQPALGFLGSFIAYFVGLAVGWHVSPTMYLPGNCQACGYDLRGTSVGRDCPECGTIVPAPPQPNASP